MNFHVDAALRKIVSHAYNETRYYRQLFDEHGIDIHRIASVEDLVRIPLLTREDIQDNEGQFLAKQYQKYPLNERLVAKRASSPSGSLLKVYRDYNHDDISNKTLWNLKRSRYGITPSDRVCSFYGSRYIGNRLVPHQSRVLTRDGRHLAFSILELTEDRLKECLDEMTEFGVDWLCIEPSTAVLLAETINRHQLPVPQSLRYVELIRELLQDDHRRLLLETLQADLAYLYSTGEIHAIAFECRHKSLHLLEDNVVVEVIRDGKPVIGEVGKLLRISRAGWRFDFRQQIGAALDQLDQGLQIVGQAAIGCLAIPPFAIDVPLHRLGELPAVLVNDVRVPPRHHLRLPTNMKNL